MNKYLEKLLSQTNISDIEDETLRKFRKKVINEMKRMGAADEHIALLKDNVIRFAIINGRSPEDLAWAILQ